MAKKKKEITQEATENQTVESLAHDASAVVEAEKDVEFEKKDLEIELPISEDIVNSYKFIEKGRYFKDGKEFIVITLVGHNI
jgi:hypothetical protein